MKDHGNKKILVVDDDETFRLLLVHTLQRAGYIVESAENGEIGVRLAQRSLPKLIVSDVMMDQLDGFGMLEQLRLDDATKTIPFIFLTGLADTESRRKGMLLGADDFLNKPFTSKALLSAVEARLEKHEAMLQAGERKLSELRSSIGLSLPHEIRTPLNGILGLSELLQHQEPPLSPATVAKYAHSVTIQVIN